MRRMPFLGRSRPRFAMAMVLAAASLVACGKGGAKKEETAEHGEEGGHQKGLIELTPEQKKNAGVATGRVEKRAQAGLLEASAEIQAAPQRLAKVGPRIEGRVASIRANVGDVVRPGESLATIDSPDLGRAKADFLAALARASVTRDTADREKLLFDKKITSEREWREAEAEAVKSRADKEAAENRLHALGVSDPDLSRMRVAGHYDSTIGVPAPIGGIIVERNVTLGQMVTPAEVLFTVMDPREVWILLDVYEKNLPQVNVGQTARVRVSAYPGQEFLGRVANVGAVFESKSRAAKARIVLPNPKGMLRPGMFATVTLEGTTGDARTLLVAPAAAVQKDGEESWVFIPRGEHEFEARQVKAGRSLGEWVEILEGLTEGETVVTAGSFFLKSERKKGELGEEGH